MWWKTRATDQCEISNFSLNWKKTTTECYKLLKKVYGENSLSCACVFEWYKRFYEDQESTKDDKCPGQLVSCFNYANDNQN